MKRFWLLNAGLLVAVMLIHWIGKAGWLSPSVGAVLTCLIFIAYMLWLAFFSRPEQASPKLKKNGLAAKLRRVSLRIQKVLAIVTILMLCYTLWLMARYHF